MVGSMMIFCGGWKFDSLGLYKIEVNSIVHTPSSFFLFT